MLRFGLMMFGVGYLCGRRAVRPAISATAPSQPAPVPESAPAAATAASGTTIESAFNLADVLQDVPTRSPLFGRIFQSPLTPASLILNAPTSGSIFAIQQAFQDAEDAADTIGLALGAFGRVHGQGAEYLYLMGELSKLNLRLGSRTIEAVLADPEVLAALDQLERQSKLLNQSAAHMRRVTATAESIAGSLGLANSVANLLQLPNVPVQEVDSERTLIV